MRSAALPAPETRNPPAAPPTAVGELSAPGIPTKIARRILPFQVTRSGERALVGCSLTLERSATRKPLAELATFRGSGARAVRRHQLVQCLRAPRRLGVDLVGVFSDDFEIVPVGADGRAVSLRPGGELRAVAARAVAREEALCPPGIRQRRVVRAGGPGALRGGTPRGRIGLRAPENRE